MSTPVPSSDPSHSPPARDAHSAFARAGLLAYAALIVYASWYPFSGWRDLGLSAFAYLWAPLPPRYWTWFDVAINVLGYIPFGMFLVCAMYPRVRGVPAALAAGMCGVLTSATMEAVQTFLPSRVASNLDLLTNGIGGCIGAIAAVLLTPKLLQQSRLLELRRRWFASTASRGLIVLALWPLAQIYPNEYLFGQGQMTPVVSVWLSQWLDADIDLGALLRFGNEVGVEHYWMVEAGITACGMAGAMAVLQLLLRPATPKAALAALLAAAALAVKALACALFFGPENAFAWLTPGALAGLVFGLPLALGVALATGLWQRRLAMLLLALELVAVNAAPSNPYFVATLQTWVQGQFLNFDGAAQFLSLWWPLFALGFLFLRQPEGHT